MQTMEWNYTQLPKHFYSAYLAEHEGSIIFQAFPNSGSYCSEARFFDMSFEDALTLVEGFLFRGEKVKQIYSSSY